MPESSRSPESGNKGPLETLRELAETATQGPWDADSLYYVLRHPEKQGFDLVVPEDILDKGEEAGLMIPSKTDAKYIAACAPRTVLNLLDVVERVNAYIDACEASDKRAEEDSFDALHVALSRFDTKISHAEVMRQAGLS